MYKRPHDRSVVEVREILTVKLRPRGVVWGIAPKLDCEIVTCSTVLEKGSRI